MVNSLFSGIVQAYPEVGASYISLLKYSFSPVWRWAHHRFLKYFASWPRAPVTEGYCSARLEKQKLSRVEI